jgi:hypothetical protein
VSLPLKALDYSFVVLLGFSLFYLGIIILCFAANDRRDRLRNPFQPLLMMKLLSGLNAIRRAFFTLRTSIQVVAVKSEKSPVEFWRVPRSGPEKTGVKL